MSDIKMKALTTFDDSAVGLVHEGTVFSCSESRARQFERRGIAAAHLGKTSKKAKPGPLAATPKKPRAPRKPKAGSQTGATDPS